MQKIIVTPRDKELFLYLFQNKIANLEQIHRDLFSAILKSTMYKRLNKLVKAKWVERNAYIEGQKILSCFNITKRCLDTHLKETFDMRGGVLKSDSIFHDLRLNDIRSFFLKQKCIDSYFTENELVTNDDLKENLKISSYGSARVDAVVRMVGRNRRLCHLGLEYEHTFKSKKRCREKIRSYYLRPQVEVILFIYEDRSIYHRFMEMEKEFSEQSRRPKLFFLDIKDMTLKNGEVIFTNLQGDRVRIK